MADDVHARFNRVDEKLDRVLEVLVTVRDRVGILEQQYTNLARRLDHVDDRLEQIERRLDLVDPAIPARPAPLGALRSGFKPGDGRVVHARGPDQ